MTLKNIPGYRVEMHDRKRAYIAREAYSASEAVRQAVGQHCFSIRPEATYPGHAIVSVLMRSGENRRATVYYPE